MTKYLHAFLLLTFSMAASANQLPIWEAGAGAAFVNFADYRGSNEQQSYLLPFPYFVYRGDFLKVDEQRIRGLFYKHPKVEAEISINGTVPVKSKDNTARKGMPDLDAALEIGPTLNIFLHHSDDKKFKLDLRLPVRAIVASDFSRVHHEGWTFQPNLNIDIKNIFNQPGWNFGFVTGPVFSSQRYHQYIYGVDSAYAAVTRPVYNASGGYAGTQILTALSKRFPNFWIGGFLRWDHLNGAVFADSPLFKAHDNFSGGFAIAWIFAKSQTMVDTGK